MCCPCLNKRLTTPFHYPSSVPFTHTHALHPSPPGKTLKRKTQRPKRHSRLFSHTSTLCTSSRCNHTRPLSHEAITSGIRLSLPSRSSHPSLQPRSRNNGHHRHRSPQSSFWVSLQVSRDRFIILDIPFPETRHLHMHPAELAYSVATPPLLSLLLI